MELKKSYYNELIKENESGEKLIYNFNTGAFILMNEKAYQLMENIEILEFKQLDDESIGYLKLMKENGLVVEKKIDEIEILDFKEKLATYDSNSLILTITPTTNCNMKCIYCYEANNKILSSTMTKEIQDAIVEFVKKKIKNLSILSVVWYGGEPLLEKEIIYYLSREFIKLSELYHVQYSASMITNGVLLDYSTSVFLKEQCRVKYVQITIDGLKEYHDKRRIMKDGSRSFDVIMDNIDKIKDILKVTIRVNVDQNNLNHIENFVYFLMNDKKIGNSVNLYFDKVNDYTAAYNCDISSFIGQKDLNSLLKKIYSNIVYNGNNNLISLESYISPKIKNCGATNINNYIIDSDGYIYKCLTLVGVKEAAIGKITEEIDVIKHKKWVFHELDTKCKVCKQRPLCQGGCVFREIQNNEMHRCKFNSEDYKFALNTIYEIERGNL